MKKSFLIALFSIAVSVSSFAQHGHDKAPGDRAAHKTEKLTQELSLSADQSAKVKAIITDHQTKNQELKAKYASATDKSQFHKEAKELREKEESDISYLLTADQKTKYEALKKSHNEGDHHGGGKHHGSGN